MRIVMIIHRYGADVAGGAETACRHVARRLGDGGHRVTVVTSCARSYVDWADEFAPGVSQDGAVQVIRLPVRHPRDPARFAALSERVVASQGRVPMHLQRLWMDAQGPVLTDLAATLASLEIDVAVIWTYLYATTASSIEVCRRLGVATVLVPTAHDEPTLRLPVVRGGFTDADGMAFLTLEERDLVGTVTPLDRPHAVVGLGTDLALATTQERGAARDLAGDEPFALCVGRIDPSKGTVALVAAMGQHLERHPDSPRLVLVGDPAHALELPGGVRHLGIVDERIKAGLLAEAVCLVQPSPYESFSLVLLEAWAQRTPAVVSAACAVTSGQVRRSGGGVVFADRAELAACVETMNERPDWREWLGNRGHKYLNTSYQWDQVLSRWEALLTEVAGSARPSTAR